MGVLEFLVPFYPINTARVFFSSSDLKMNLLNLYPNIGIQARSIYCVLICDMSALIGLEETFTPQP